MTKIYNKYTGTEDSLQIAIANYLDSRKVLWCHPPNGGRRDRGTAIKLKRQGVKPGVPDVLIFEPKSIYHGLAIELKIPGGIVSIHQATWLKALSDRKYKTSVCFSLDEAIDVINEYLKLK